MTEKTMEKLLIDLILKYRYDTCFSDDKEQVKETFYTEITRLYHSEPELFGDVSRSILENWCALLDTEEYQIKMECADIWSRSGIDVLLFEIRFYLNIDGENDTALLKSKIKSVYSNVKAGIVEKRDEQNPYENLLLRVSRSPDPADLRIKNAFESISASDMAQDVDGIVSYVFLNDLLGRNRGTPRYMKDIWHVIADLSVIAGDGIGEWIAGNSLRNILSVSASADRMGLTDIGGLLKELYDNLLKNKSDPAAKERIIACAETDFYTIYNDEMIYEAAENYRKKQE